MYPTAYHGDIPVSGKSPMLRAVLTLSLLMLSLEAVASDTLRCGNSLITEGMSEEQVAAKCGTPASTTVRTAPIMSYKRNGTRYQSGERVMHRWHYQRSPGQFDAVLVFEGGALTAIELLH
ncbi:DUF2845 domain-containing protein [Chitiniphilus eburneus]|uniref:DUF2845 domain-containing protein n=1 Tax=Chitiniphilus eburneus TaxID=2571148 RepID=A0A4U0PNI3_9NEIS|nr:DUF2845 domain-containing protein [Chitiniphilus eburneus]TJZ69781.1 DUF2845 domain-containing protein [Chitiniphilus eburneus]